MKARNANLVAAILTVLCLAASARTQTSAFTYQGNLLSGGNPANGNFDFEFKLFDAVSAGTQQGGTQQRLNVAVANSVFAVSLDFGAGTLPGADRFLDIAVRTAGGGAFTSLAPRQKVNSSPYSVRSLNSTTADVATNATQLGGVAANQYVLTGDPRMSDPRPPTAGSENYIQNGASPQASSNFNISGNGTVGGTLNGNLVNSATQFNINGTRVLSNAGTFNVFAGAGAGTAIPDGIDNAFFGYRAGNVYQSGSNNSIFGAHAGEAGNLGSSNTLIGSYSGLNILGANASENTFIGSFSGSLISNGRGTTLLGFGTGSSSGSLLNATAIGNRAFVAQSNSLILGSISGVNNCTVANNCDDTRVGIGTAAPVGNLHINVPGSGNPISVLTLNVGSFGTGTNATNSYFFKARDVGGGSTPAFLIRGDGNVGIATDTPTERLDVIGNIKASGTISGRGALPWQVVSGLTQQAQPNNGYITTNNAQVTVTLPASPNIGDVVRVSSTGPGGWKIAQNAGQSILGSALGLIGGVWIPRENNRSWYSIASSADGNNLVAAVLGGQIYTSTDSGSTWTPRDSNRSWESVASSSDGTKLVAAAFAGQLYTSTNSGVSWAPRDSIRNWFAVASSADGSNLVAAHYGGQIYTSTNSGVSWTPRDANRDWYSLASSANGSRLAAVVAGGQIFTSPDFGVTWTPRETAQDWKSIAMSADGSRLIAAGFNSQIYISTDYGATWLARESNRSWKAVAISNDGQRMVAAVQSGAIYVSLDSGTSWTPRLAANWYAVASSADGSRFAAAANGGQIYTSVPLTTTGVTGYLSGAQYSAIELQYVGNGLFVPLSHEGQIQGN